MLSRRDAIKSTLALAAGAVPLPAIPEPEPDERTLLLKIQYDPSLSEDDIYTVVDCCLVLGAMFTNTMGPSHIGLRQAIDRGMLKRRADKVFATFDPSRIGINLWERASA